MSDQSSDPSRPFDPPAPPTTPPAPPVAPPAPPAPPEPPRPEVPQYGEYAPASAPNPYGVPGYPAAAAPTPPAAPSAPTVYGAPTYGAPAYAPPGPQRKTWDLVLTIVLLTIGVIGAFIGATSGLGLHQAIQQQYDAHGLGTYRGDTGTAAAVLAISHLVLYLVAVGLSILSLVKKRTTFWIPLVIGVVAAIIFWSVLVAVIVGDPTLMNALTRA